MVPTSGVYHYGALQRLVVTSGLFIVLDHLCCLLNTYQTAKLQQQKNVSRNRQAVEMVEKI